MKMLTAVLNLFDEIVIIRDVDDNIICINKEDKIDICTVKPEGKEIRYNRKVYSLSKKQTEIEGKKYFINIYTDITKNKNLQEKVSYDELTKLYNFSKLKEELANCIKEFNETEEPFIVILADIDNFKLVNDTIGHIQSNDILVEISKTLKNNVRCYDVVGRFGGEEFLIILRRCSLENAFKKTEELRTKIEELNVHDYKVTISFGINIYDGTDDIENVLKKADKALYDSKSKGKNITTIYKE